MNAAGDIRISAFTHKALGEPDSYMLMFDRERSVIGLRPARLAVEKNAFPAMKRGYHGGKLVRGHRLCREFGIAVSGTVRFHKCQIDHTGVLILDLNQTVPGTRGRPMPAKDAVQTDERGGRFKLDENGNKWYTY